MTTKHQPAVKRGDVRTDGMVRYKAISVSKNGHVKVVTSAGDHGRYSEKPIEMTAREFIKRGPLKEAKA